ncbi:MAG: hypothetical protein IMF13_06775 [Proteobacteria bacterium]|nr:hypothetical protein [Pseudomonadota bacterium]
MKFLIQDRLNMGFIFPLMADLLTLDTCHEIKEKVKLSVKEMEQVDYQNTGDGRAWIDNTKQGPPKEISFTDSEIYLLQDLLREKINAKQVPSDAREVCHKIQDLVPKEKRPENKRPKR